MALIDIANLHFAHDDGRVIFDNVSLQLDTNWKLGLIGRNGRGKTTFLKLLAGQYAHGGSIRAPMPMDYFPFAVDNPDLPAAELAGRIIPGLEDWRLEREASLLKLAPEALERPFNTLSGGEATKLLLAALFLREGGFALIDEPTNHLDLEARQAVGAYLRAKRGFILVSHDRALLDDCVDHVLSVNRADIELQRGNFSSWSENRARMDQNEQARHDKLKKDAERLRESAQRSEEWSGRAEKGKYGAGPVDRGFIGHKAAKMMKRAKSVEGRRNDALEEKAALLRNVENQAPLSMRTLPFHSGNMAEFASVCAGYDGRNVVEDVTFRVRAGDRLALKGGNGSGKSTLLKLLAGEEAKFAATTEAAGKTGTREESRLGAQCGGVALAFGGGLRLAPGLIVSYVPQDASFPRGSLKNFARERGIDESLLRAVLHRFGFERDQFDSDMAGFSAGQKKKALLGASLCREAHLYVWDEPLNYIDVISRVQIENLILEYRPTMVFVEHDRVFAERIATAIIEL